MHVNQIYLKVVGKRSTTIAIRTLIQIAANVKTIDDNASTIKDVFAKYNPKPLIPDKIPKVTK